MPAIDLENVGKSYWPGPVQALSDVTLDVREGEILTLLGPSGCGKTTTLRLIAGFEAPDEGTICVRDMAVSGNGEWVSPEHRGVGMVFQDYALFPHLSVGENVMFGLHRRPKKQRPGRAKEVLELLDLAHHFDRYPHELSGGQQQRVALARALITDPKVLLLDEPLSALDEFLRLQMREELRRLQADIGITFIHVTHTQPEALALADLIVVMDEGRIDQAGTAREIFDAPTTSYVAEFMGGWNVFRGEVREVKNGTADVLTEAGETISMTGTAVVAGEHIDFSIRRDRIGVARSNGAGAAVVNGVTGVVHGIEYQGTWVKVTMAREGGAGLLVANVQEAVFFGDPVAVGDSVKANWTEKDIHLLSR